MTKLNTTLIIVNILITLFAILYIVFKYNGEKIANLLYKLNDSESDCLSKYKRKHELIIQMIDEVKKKYKVDSKVFYEAKDLNIDSLDSFKNEKVLNKCYKEIIQIREDNTKVRETKAFKDLFHEYNENEIHLISLRTYHNKYTLIYNNLVKKFPLNIIRKIKRFPIIELIEGQELNNGFNNDLEV